MFKLLQNLDCYTPKHIGKNDILICGDRIYKIQPKIEFTDRALFEEIYDCTGLLAAPGFIDQHVHIIGGGGENGYSSRIDEIDFNQIIQAGVTALVGLLGADSCTKSPDALYAKAKALESQGISTYLYSGSYSMPVVTYTGSIVRDLVLIDKVIGIGEIAVSDHRSSHAGLERLLKAASDTHLGGLLSGKAGIMHLHLGEGKAGLAPVLQMIENSDLPLEMFVPTHVNRNEELFSQAMEFCKSGGNIDLTSGETEGISVSDAIGRLVRAKIDLSNVTVSSDANGSIPSGGVGLMQTLYDDIINCMNQKIINPEIGFRLVSENVARRLKLHPKKGVLCEGSDADILIMDSAYRIKRLISSGKILLENEWAGA